MMFFPSPGIFLSLWGINIHLYAICIATAAIFAYLLGQYRFKKLGYDSEILSDYFFGLLFLGIIGARVWYVIFMWQDYVNNPIEIIMINHGGLAIQGGIFVGLIYSYFYFKKKNIPFLQAGDAILPGVLVAQAIGRWGNFFNQEAHGGITSLEHLKSLHIPDFIIQGMYIDGSYYIPTFLYESVLNIIGFLLIILLVRRIQKKQGLQFFCYFIWYGIVRFFVEGMRTDSLYFMGLRTAQLISIVFVIVGIVGIIYIKYKGEDALL